MNEDLVKQMASVMVFSVIIGLAMFLGLSQVTLTVEPQSEGEQLGVGSLPIENYVPAIKFNSGYNSNFGVTSAATITGEQLTSTDDLTVTDDVNVQGDVLQLGSDTDRTTIYIGASDGCTALYAAASTTLTAQATSSSFCN